MASSITRRARLVCAAMACVLGACGDHTEKKSEPPPKTPAERIAEVRQLIQAKDAPKALAAIDRLFPGDTSPMVVEERARAHEVMLGACSTDACRYLAATQANAASATPVRAKLVESIRPKVDDELSMERVTAKLALERLRQLRELGDAGSLTMQAVTAEADLQGRAKAAVTFASAERAKVPLLKADVAVVEELLGPSKMNEKSVPVIALDGVAVFVSIDRTGKCAGLFATGSQPSKRAYTSKQWPPERLLSQALGRPVTVRLPPAGSSTLGPSTSAWTEAGVPIVVRWDVGEIIEMRIGDAAP